MLEPAIPIRTVAWYSGSVLLAPLFKISACAKAFAFARDDGAT